MLAAPKAKAGNGSAAPAPPGGGGGADNGGKRAAAPPADGVSPNDRPKAQSRLITEGQAGGSNNITVPINLMDAIQDVAAVLPTMLANTTTTADATQPVIPANMFAQFMAWQQLMATQVSSSALNYLGFFS